MEASLIGRPSPRRHGGPRRLLRLRSDDQLVAMFRMGYDEAFEAIHIRYRPALLAYTRQMLGWSHADAEDALQEVFLRAYPALRRDDRPVTLRAWLYRIAHNYCVDQIRRPAPAPDDVYDVSRPPHSDPATEAERAESLRLVVSDIGRLPEHQRTAILMNAAEGMRYVEIAGALGITEPAVKSVLNRARRGLNAAEDARNASCRDIRAELERARDRKVRMSGRSRRHLRDCAGCAKFKAELVRVDRALHALGPHPGPLVAIAKLLGLGGAGSGVVAAGGGAAVGGGGVAGGTIAGGAIAAKVTAIVCCGAAFVGVARLQQDARTVTDGPKREAPAPAPHRAAHSSAHRGTVLTHVDRPGPVAAAPLHVSAPYRTVRVQPAAPARPSSPAVLIPTDRAIVTHRAITAAPGTYTSPRDAERQTGGVAAPDEEPAPSGDTTVRDETTPAGAVAHPDATGPSDQGAAPMAPDAHAAPPPTAPAPEVPPAGAATPPAPKAPASGGTVASTPAPEAGASAPSVGAPTPATP